MQGTVFAVTTPEFADAAFQAVITASLAIFALVLFHRLPQRWVAWWAAAWSLYVVRLLAILMYLATHDLAWLFWHQVATGWVALAILWAALVFSRDLPWRWGYAAVGVFPLVWAWVAIHALDRFMLVAAPMVALISAATLWTAWVFWRYWRRTGAPGAQFVAFAFTLWGLHHLDYPILRARGEWLPWGYFLDILFELAVGIGFAVLVLSDLAQRLALRTDELARVSALTIRQNESERRRLSRELHDETAQTLSAVKLEVGMLREGADPVAADRLDHILRLVDNGIQGIRRVMNDLRPALLDDLGLLPAVRSLADDVRERSELAVDVSLPASIPRLAPERELALFRAAQEALANVLRHASASRVILRLRTEAGRLILEVRDNGRGLPGGKAGRVEAVANLGLAGMRERITAMGGKVSVVNGVPDGVIVTVELPIGASAK
jgi:signal transduction histidine kinase